MKDPVLLNVLVTLLYPVLIALIMAIVRLHKSITNLKFYSRLICNRMEIDCGKDLD